MKKETISEDIKTFNIPFMTVLGGEQVGPDSKIVADCLAYFKKNYTNWKDFALSEIENDRWYYFTTTKEWRNLGNTVKLTRIKPTPREGDV